MQIEKWSIVKTENPFDKPSNRFAHTMNLYNDYLIIFGGAGAYSKSSKMRVCNREMHVFDLKAQKWLQNIANTKENIFSPTRRMYHVSAIYGNKLLIHGGINTDDKKVYSDYFLLDLTEFKWKPLNKKYDISSIIGARKMHTLTSVIPSDCYMKDINDLWTYNLKDCSKILPYENWGMYMFGGYKHGVGQTNDLYLIKPFIKSKIKSRTGFKVKSTDHKAFSLE